MLIPACAPSLQVHELDSEGRYLALNAAANQLRYPNAHTQYFSCVLLMLFAETKHDTVKEQITRVLLERLVVNRPHPWVRPPHAPHSPQHMPQSISPISHAAQRMQPVLSQCPLHCNCCWADL